MPFSFHISQATFSDNTTLEFGRDDIVVFVGPNNSGKSEALRSIQNSILLGDRQGIVVIDGTTIREGSDDEVASWFDTNSHRVSDEHGIHYRNEFTQAGIGLLQTVWQNRNHWAMSHTC